MVRSSFSFLACLVVGRVASHPLCYVDDKPTDLDEHLDFCPEAQHGACCTDLEEASVRSIVDEAHPLSDTCYDLYKQVGFFRVVSFWSHHRHARFGILTLVDTAAVIPGTSSSR